MQRTGSGRLLCKLLKRHKLQRPDELQRRGRLLSRGEQQREGGPQRSTEPQQRGYVVRTQQHMTHASEAGQPLEQQDVAAGQAKEGSSTIAECAL
eukprot:1138033-Pelagomonas_calceolata.AAC.2